MPNNFESAVFYELKANLDFANSNEDLLIIDKAVVPLFRSSIASWNSVYEVEGGEQLKDWKTATDHIQRICEMWGVAARRNSRVIVCGGGSVGDFGGFFASILKRGVRLVHIPTTWLSAMDSAHGGKTALNIAGIKNQVGTFYPAQAVYIFKDILFSQTQDRAVDGFGECLKMLMLESPVVVEAVFKSSSKELNEFLWEQLKTVVQKKYDIVASDPFEKRGTRKLLNLGHTFGHALEAKTGQSHGLCVLQGLVFSLRWSLNRGYLSDSLLQKIVTFIRGKDIPIWDEQSERVHFSESELTTLLSADKKSFGKNELDFVFVRNEGNVFCEKIKINDMISEANRQGWIK